MPLTAHAITKARLLPARPPGAQAPSIRLLVGHALTLALLFTLADCPKPMHVDDPAYYYNAVHLSRHPLSPYGFDIFWYEYPEPAMAVLAPPVLPYWWAIGIRLFGEHVVLWKLWLLPFSLAFTLSLAALFHRFTPRLEIPLLWLTVLSPAYLPAFNLMLDIPALALGLAAVAVFLEALDRNSFRLALLAGVCAAFAMETKYTACTAPAVMLAAGILGRRPALGLVAAVTAGLGFVAWEGFIYWRQGASHFLYVLGLGDAIRRRSCDTLSLALLSLVGGVAPAAGLLGLVALGAGRKLFALASMGVVTAYALIGWQQWQWTIFRIMGGCVWLVLLAVLVRILWKPGTKGFAKGARGCDWFLLAWLAIEVTLYFAISPFPAVRRVMGVIVVLVLIAGRLASVTSWHGARRGLVWAAAGISMALGLFFASLDWWEARVRQAVVEQALALIHTQDPSPSHIWYTGHWGFQYYAERAGMTPIIADGPALHQGDWLVLTLGGQDSQMIWFPPGTFERYSPPLAPDDGIPYSTQGLYLGPAPLDHHAGPRIRVGIGRMIVDRAPTSLLPPDLLVRWAAERNRPLPKGAIPSVKRALEDLPKMGEKGRAALPSVQRLAERGEPAVREEALQAAKRLAAAGKLKQG